MSMLGRKGREGSHLYVFAFLCEALVFEPRHS
jgi:hypothetical protein